MMVGTDLFFCLRAEEAEFHLINALLLSFICITGKYSHNTRGCKNTPPQKKNKRSLFSWSRVVAVPQNTALLLVDSSAGFLQSAGPEGGATPVVRGPEVELLRAAADRYQCVLSHWAPTPAGGEQL